MHGELRHSAAVGEDRVACGCKCRAETLSSVSSGTARRRGNLTSLQGFWAGTGAWEFHKKFSGH